MPTEPCPYRHSPAFPRSSLPGGIPAASWTGSRGCVAQRRVGKVFPRSLAVDATPERDGPPRGSWCPMCRSDRRHRPSPRARCPPRIPRTPRDVSRRGSQIPCAPAVAMPVRCRCVATNSPRRQPILRIVQAGTVDDSVLPASTRRQAGGRRRISAVPANRKCHIAAGRDDPRVAREPF